MNSNSILSLALVLSLLPSCASITRGTRDNVTVTSEPSGANLRLSDGTTGVTPAKFKPKRTEPLSIEVSKPGYQTEVVRLTPHVSGRGVGMMAGNVLIGGLIGIGIDAATGATKDLQPNPVHVNLRPARR